MLIGVVCAVGLVIVLVILWLLVGRKHNKPPEFAGAGYGADDADLRGSLSMRDPEMGSIGGRLVLPAATPPPVTI